MNSFIRSMSRVVVSSKTSTWMSRDNVCIIGVDVVHALFPYEDPIDKEIRINGNPYHVIGVMEPLGNFFGQSRDNSLFIPDQHFRQVLPRPSFPGSCLLHHHPAAIARLRQISD